MRARHFNLTRLSTSPQAGCLISIPEPVDLCGQPIQPPSEELTFMTVASLAFICERRWLARFSRWLRGENRASRMRAARAARAVVECHVLAKVAIRRDFYSSEPT